jgi:hypothetical protein
MINKFHTWLVVLMLVLVSCLPEESFLVNNVTTETQTPTFLIESSTMTSLPSVTPSSTLTPSEVQELITKVTTSDEICSFPCWSGIIPGKTYWSDISNFLESFARVRKNSPSQPSGYTILVPNLVNPPPENEDWFATIYLDDNDVVKYIEGNRKKISIDQLMSKYGIPDEIKLFILGVLPSDKVEKFRFVFSYKKQGFLIIYDGEAENKNLLNICLSNITDDPSFWIWNSEDDSAFAIITEDKLYSSFWNNWSQYQEISIATKGEVTLDSFYETYTNPANIDVCFQVPSPSFP